MDRIEIRRRIMERIESLTEWEYLQHGEDRLVLLQAAFQEGWGFADRRAVPR
jgi:hypothetical protein